MVKILQGSVVTQTMLGGLAIYPRVANFLQCIQAKNYEIWLAVDKVIAKIIRLTFFGPPCKCIAGLALDLVAAPASQAYVERLFSVCGVRRHENAKKQSKVCKREFS